MTTASLSQRGRQRVALGLLLFFENRAVAHDDVPALPVQLQDANFDLAIVPSLQVMHRPQLDLRSWQERPHANIHHQPALDPLQNLPLQIRMFPVSLLDPLPYAAAMRAHVRQQHVAIPLLVQPLDLNCLSRAELNRRARIQKLLRWHQPFEFPADIHHHARFGNGQHAPIENLALRHDGFRSGELIEQLVHRLRYFARLRRLSRSSGYMGVRNASVASRGAYFFARDSRRLVRGVIRGKLRDHRCLRSSRDSGSSTAALWLRRYRGRREPYGVC